MKILALAAWYKKEGKAATTFPLFYNARASTRALTGRRTALYLHLIQISKLYSIILCKSYANDGIFMNFFC